MYVVYVSYVLLLQDSPILPTTTKDLAHLRRSFPRRCAEWQRSFKLLRSLAKPDQVSYGSALRALHRVEDAWPVALEVLRCMELRPVSRIISHHMFR